MHTRVELDVPQAPFRRLTEIVSDRLNTNDNRAAECLRHLERLHDDSALPDFRAAAQTFALLAIADAISGVAASGEVRPAMKETP